jgi:hypothetical protein
VGVPGIRYCSKKGLGDVRPAHGGGVAGLRDGARERHLDTGRVEVGDDLLGALDPLVLGTLAEPRDLGDVDPVAEQVQLLGHRMST